MNGIFMLIIMNGHVGEPDKETDVGYKKGVRIDTTINISETIVVSRRERKASPP